MDGDSTLPQSAVAVIAGVSVRTVQRWPLAAVKSGREKHYRLEDVIDFLASREAEKASRIAGRLEEAIDSARRRELAARNERLALEAQLARFTAAGENE